MEPGLCQVGDQARDLRVPLFMALICLSTSSVTVNLYLRAVDVVVADGEPPPVESFLFVPSRVNSPSFRSEPSRCNFSAFLFPVLPRLSMEPLLAAPPLLLSGRSEACPAFGLDSGGKRQERRSDRCRGQLTRARSRKDRQTDP